MRKKELIQIHKTLSLALREIKENGGESPDIDLENYKGLGVNPTDIHKKKNEQEEAILELARSIGEGIEEFREEFDESDDVTVEEIDRTRQELIELYNNSDQLEK
jgi:hypothetical protein